MKIVVLLALVAACVATPVARGRRHPHNVLVDTDSQSKWDYIGLAYGNARAWIEGFAEQVKDIANNDNAEVGRVLSTHVNAALIKVKGPLDQMRDSIVARTLTRDETTAVYERLEQILATYETNTADIIPQLSQDAQDDIQGLYEVFTQDEVYYFSLILSFLD